MSADADLSLSVNRSPSHNSQAKCKQALADFLGDSSAYAEDSVALPLRFCRADLKTLDYQDYNLEYKFSLAAVRKPELVKQGLLPAMPWEIPLIDCGVATDELQAFYVRSVAITWNGWNYRAPSASTRHRATCNHSTSGELARKTSARCTQWVPNTLDFFLGMPFWLLFGDTIPGAFGDTTRNALWGYRPGLLWGYHPPEG